MRRHIKAGATLLVCAMLTLGPATGVHAEENVKSSSTTAVQQQEAASSTQKQESTESTTEHSTQTHTKENTTTEKHHQSSATEHKHTTTEHKKNSSTHKKKNTDAQKKKELEKKKAAEKKKKEAEKKKKAAEKKKKEAKKKKAAENKNKAAEKKKKEAEKKKKAAEKKEKESKAIIPKVYNDTRLQMKDKKETLNGFVYFNQADEAWNENGYHIHSSGCGPTAMAVCISSLTGKWVTPLDTTIWAYDHGYYSISGAVHDMVPALAKQYKLKCNGLQTDIASIRKALQAGHPVVALMGPGYFTSKGHFIVLVGIDKDDQVTVADVGSRGRSAYKYPLKDVVSQSKSASAGGPFWEIYNPKQEDQKVKDATKKQIEDAKVLTVKKHSKEYWDMYYDIKAVLQKNYQLIVPLKEGKLTPEEQMVTLVNLKINDEVTIVDSHNQMKTDITLGEIVEQINKKAVNGSFQKTVTIDPNHISFTN